MCAGAVIPGSAGVERPQLSQGRGRASWAQPGWNRPSRHLLTLRATGRSPPVLKPALSVKARPQRRGREVWPLEDRPAAPAGPGSPSPAAALREGCVKGRGPLGGGQGYTRARAFGLARGPSLGNRRKFQTREPRPAGGALGPLPGPWPPQPTPVPVPPPAGSAFPSLGCLRGAVCQHVDPTGGDGGHDTGIGRLGVGKPPGPGPPAGTRAWDLGPDARTRSPKPVLSTEF